jgi:DNA helicase HerA-like ATPase
MCTEAQNFCGANNCENTLPWKFDINWETGTLPKIGFQLKEQEFKNKIQESYSFKGPSLLMGGAMVDGKPVQDLQVRAPLSMFNRHGLISGATGTGKTKTLQGIAEGLSDAGVPVLLMDIKGDLSGLAAPGSGHPKIDERHNSIGVEWKPSSFPVELMSLSGGKEVNLRATISEFGPVLLSKMLGLNDTQQGVMAMTFKYCDDHGLPLLDIKDLRTALNYIRNEAKEEINRNYGYVSPQSLGAIQRKLLELEQQGAEQFFGEISMDVDDLIAHDSKGRGYIHVVRLMDMQTRPKLFSSFMLCMLAEIFEKFPEQGDDSKPQLIMFIDEAHLLFEEVSDDLLKQLETIIKLIRSKGVGVFFCTQLPDDIPEDVLSQLGMKVQHALRAFTARDRKTIRKVAENYPITDFYKLDRLITEMGIGEALITTLNEKGIPTPVVHTLLKAPASRMDVISDSEVDEVLAQSHLAKRYNKAVDRHSAHEILMQKLEQAENKAEELEEKPRTGSTRKRKTQSDSTLESIMKSRTTQTIVRELTRGLLGVLGVSTRRRRSR